MLVIPHESTGAVVAGPIRAFLRCEVDLTTQETPGAADRSAAISIVYDGDCPFCTSYVRLVRLREAVGRVELVDARSAHPLVRAVTERGFDLNVGMVVVLDGEYHFGDSALNRLSLLSSPNGLFNRVMRFVFVSPRASRALYPFLVGCRNLTLRVLGRSPIRLPIAADDGSVDGAIKQDRDDRRG